MKIAVNMSTRQIAQPGLVDTISQILAEAQLSAQSVSLEITESILTQPNEKNMGAWRQLNDIGIQLCVDHFGTGNFSLSYLQQFLIHTLKIDQSFMVGIDQDHNDITISDAIIAMAKSLHLEVIAEGVETAEQARFLASHGCLSAQGYYYGRPVATEAFATLM
jgi:EAL domain-containing protein (putative c-di-GMP-specific phosphodiesterase class I)